MDAESIELPSLEVIEWLIIVPKIGPAEEKEVITTMNAVNSRTMTFSLFSFLLLEIYRRPDKTTSVAGITNGRTEDVAIRFIVSIDTI